MVSCMGSLLVGVYRKHWKIKIVSHIQPVAPCGNINPICDAEISVRCLMLGVCFLRYQGVSLPKLRRKSGGQWAHFTRKTKTATEKSALRAQRPTRGGSFNGS